MAVTTVVGEGAERVIDSLISLKHKFVRHPVVSKVRVNEWLYIWSSSIARDCPVLISLCARLQLHDARTGCESGRSTRRVSGESRIPCLQTW